MASLSRGNKMTFLVSLCILLGIGALVYYAGPRNQSPVFSKPAMKSYPLYGVGNEYNAKENNVDSQPAPSVTTIKLPTFHPSKELFIRAVYFDGRARNNHQNSSVFLIVAKKSITDNKLIVACQVDNLVSRNYVVRLIGETPLFRHFYPKIDHEEAFVECFDMPAKNGSMGYIHYKTDANAKVKITATERRLYIPRPRVEPSTAEGKKYGFTIAACAKVFGGSPPWLEEWLRYQRALGVQHVHVDAEDTFKSAGGLERNYIKTALEEGFLSIDVWNRYLSSGELWYHNQGLIYEDCVYRNLGVYDYLILMDTDDFLTPRVPSEKQLYFYINKYCRGRNTGSCKFKWIEYYPDQFGLNKSIPIPDGNVTRQLKNYSHYIQGNPKSLHRTNVIIDAATHYAHKMLDGFKIETVSPDAIYAAHIRRRNKLAKGNSLHIGLPHSNGCLEHTLSTILLCSMIFLVFLSS